MFEGKLLIESAIHWAILAGIFGVFTMFAAVIKSLNHKHKTANVKLFQSKTWRNEI